MIWAGAMLLDLNTFEEMALTGLKTLVAYIYAPHSDYCASKLEELQRKLDELTEKLKEELVRAGVEEGLATEIARLTHEVMAKYPYF